MKNHEKEQIMRTTTTPILILLVFLSIVVGATVVGTVYYAPLANEHSYSNLIQTVNPAVVDVVSVYTVQKKNKAGKDETAIRKASGAGFIIDPSGYIVTNAHVVNKADVIIVRFNDSVGYAATLIGVDPTSDLALIKINGKNLPTVKWGDSSKVKIGDPVIGIGDPYEVGKSAFFGHISGTNRYLGDSDPFGNFFQLDASANRGNSGGPLFNMYGQVIGITSQIFSPTGSSIGIAFAIPSTFAEKIIGILKSGGKPKYGSIGAVFDDILTNPVENTPGGPQIIEVVKGSAAEKGGLKNKDVILSFNGQPVINGNDLITDSLLTQPGTSVKLNVWRAGKIITLTIIEGERN